jgi:fatty acid desaturase
MGENREHARAVEWPTMALVGFCYLAWFGLGHYLYSSLPWLALVLMAFTIALHSSLQHEVLHGHPTRHALMNEALVFLPLGLFYPFRRFKVLHLTHHNDERLTDPYDDPESYYRSAMDWERIPGWLRRVLEVNNTMLGRFFLGPALMSAGFAWSEIQRMRKGERRVFIAWLLHFIGMIPVYLMVTRVFHMPFWLYVVVPAYFGLALITIRTYAEHRWSETPEGRTIIVERSPLGLLFLNNNLHLVHHKNPTTPWYDLPRLFAERRAEWVAMNEGYVFKGYLDLFRAFALRRKEDNVHPALRRAHPPAE